jgi:HK97 gp10 family phage protein
MSVWRVDWRGREVLEDLKRAQKKGLEKTGGRLVDRARRSHPSWRTQTGEAERSIQTEPVKMGDNGGELRFGSSLERFKYLEFGARGRPGDSTLRRAMDVEGGHLEDEIRSEYR